MKWVSCAQKVFTGSLTFSYMFLIKIKVFLPLTTYKLEK